MLGLTGCKGKPAADADTAPAATTAPVSEDTAVAPEPDTAEPATGTAAPEADASETAAPSAADATAATQADAGSAAADDDFVWKTEQFADIKILRYRIPGFDELSPQQKKLAYYLSQAALSGRDMTWAQNTRHGLLLRRTLEGIDKAYTGDKSAAAYKDAFTTYLKRVWFSYGNFHHYSSKKFLPDFTKEDFAGFVENTPAESLPLAEGQTKEDLLKALEPVIFDAAFEPQGTSKDPDGDLVTSSFNNFYEGVTQAEVEAFYKAKKATNPDRVPMWGLSSRLVKQEDGTIVEIPQKIGGLYGEAIEKVVGWLEKAATVAENDAQKASIETLIAFYKTGDPEDFEKHGVAWVADTQSKIDFVNGFIETYGDAMDLRGTYESIVSLRDEEATKRIAAISNEAAWFEKNSPIPDEYKKEDVKGITAKVITIITGSGDSGPAFPIGINLPNSDWIRKDFGSKSVSLGNIVHSYEEASKSSGILEEFAESGAEIARAKAHDDLGDKLHTDMHEVIGHASGKMKEGVASSSETLKHYASALEEGRADLVALYFLMDPKLVEIGVMDSLETGKAAYDDYIRNGLLVQLARVPLGENIEEAHMRNRAMIARWALEKGAPDNVIERIDRDGKTYFRVNDYDKLRELFGKLLNEIQRIKSEGDFEAGKALIEGYGVKIDPALHAQVIERYKKLGIAPYGGFINPRLVPVTEGDEIVDVKVEYPTDFADQMREYAEKYSFLPTPKG
ncbi:MAG: dihydrofolate reductase [Deltaproteobacteria bacterium]|nr:dihydrofolate reductase [Deltaproteobacteria bacterium]